MRNVYIGDRGTLVQYLQLALNRAGIQVTIDGEFGRETCEGLRSFLGEGAGCYADRAIWEKLVPYLKGYIEYVVKQGDTINNIAQSYGSSVGNILKANPSIEDESNLEIGMNVKVPFSFELVSEEVDYSSILNDFIIEGLAVRYPFLVTGSIGQSVMGKEIKYIQIGTGKKQIFYNASFHANEWITTPVLLKFVEEYASAYANDQSLYGENSRQLFEEYSLFLVPMVNPDGVDLVTGVLKNSSYETNARMIAASYPDIPYPDGWKANINGIDLNLQFPAGWELAKRIKTEQGFTSPAPRDYVGPGPLTAPESIHVYEFTLQHDFRLILAYHSQGEVIYWKYRDYEPEDSKRIAEYFGWVSGYMVEETPYASGNAGYKDWFIQDYNRPGYTIEVGMGENPLPMSQFQQIYEDNRYILLGGMTQIERKM